MIYRVYVLKSSKDGKHYVGHTKDLKRRIDDHNRGKSRSVKNRGPFTLIFSEMSESAAAAKKKKRKSNDLKAARHLRN